MKETSFLISESVSQFEQDQVASLAKFLYSSSTSNGQGSSNTIQYNTSRGLSNTNQTRNVKSNTIEAYSGDSTTTQLQMEEDTAGWMLILEPQQLWLEQVMESSQRMFADG